MSSKSANYCFSEDSGDIGLLLLCEAELGKPSLRLTDAGSKAGERVSIFPGRCAQRTTLLSMMVFTSSTMF